MEAISLRTVHNVSQEGFNPPSPLSGSWYSVAQAAWPRPFSLVPLPVMLVHLTRNREEFIYIYYPNILPAGVPGTYRAEPPRAQNFVFIAVAQQSVFTQLILSSLFLLLLLFFIFIIIIVVVVTLYFTSFFKNYPVMFVRQAWVTKTNLHTFPRAL